MESVVASEGKSLLICFTEAYVFVQIHLVLYLKKFDAIMWFGAERIIYA